MDFQPTTRKITLAEAADRREAANARRADRIAAMDFLKSVGEDLADWEDCHTPEQAKRVYEKISRIDESLEH